MVRFAKDCMFKAWALTQKLEVKLGPDTADLSLRVGLHSGPVTAGVLRGERSRFQLFGDTVSAFTLTLPRQWSPAALLALKDNSSVQIMLFADEHRIPDGIDWQEKLHSDQRPDGRFIDPKWETKMDYPP